MFDRLQLSKALTRTAKASVEDILRADPAGGSGRARVIGVTGAPGAGKSTLIGRVAALRLQRVDSLAIIAVDPTSPRSDGSLLGDRIRMSALSEDPRVFIRSVPSRAAEDGLTDNVAEMLDVLDEFGFDEIIIETVGAGQTAYGVRALADTELLVLTPGAGDYVQAMKAGIMETADIYVVNKADLPGAPQVVAELHGVLQVNPSAGRPPIIQVRPDECAGIELLDAAIQASLFRSPDTQERQDRKRVRRKFQVHRLVQRRLQEIVSAAPACEWDSTVAVCYERVLGRLAGSTSSEELDAALGSATD